jgi:hypothetical protein
VPGAQLRETFRFPRGEDQQRPFEERPDTLERREHRLVFPLHRASGDYHHPARRDAEETQQPLLGARARGGVRDLQGIELEAAGYGDAAGVCPQLHEPPAGLFTLHAEPIHVIEHAPEERAHHPVARKRSLRYPAVDDGRLHAGLAAGAQQVRPDLGLHHDEEPGLHQRQRAPHYEGEVEREIEECIDVLDLPPRHLLPGDRRRGHEDTQVRVSLPQVFHERPGRQRLSHRDGVDPYRRLAVEIEGDRKASEALAQRADVFLVTDRLVDEIRRRRRDDENDKQAVQEMHAAAPRAAGTDLGHSRPPATRSSRRGRSLNPMAQSEGAEPRTDDRAV